MTDGDVDDDESTDSQIIELERQLEIAKLEAKLARLKKLSSPKPNAAAFH